MPQDPFYLAKPWIECRNKYLRLHPYCRICLMLGQKVRAVEVDHIRAVNRGGAPFAHANLRGLCRSHHSQKTASVDMPGRAARAFVVTGPDGYPIHAEGPQKHLLPGKVVPSVPFTTQREDHHGSSYEEGHDEEGHG